MFVICFKSFHKGRKKSHYIWLQPEETGSATKLFAKCMQLYLAVSLHILGHLARQNVTEGGEGVVHRLVVNGLVQVLDEHVAHARPVTNWINVDTDTMQG